MVPLACITGKWHVIDTKPSLLAMGVAVAIPLGDDGQEDWVTQPRFSAVVSPDPENGRPLPLLMEDTTDDPTVVDLARRFVEMVKFGNAHAGPMLISPRGETQAKRI